MKIRIHLYLVFLFVCLSAKAQDVSILKQFNGPYDFTFIGNTLNKEENTFGACEILTSSSAELALDAENKIEKAYLYWAGSGLGDFEVKLNDIDLNAERTFSASLTYKGKLYSYFSAFVDITDIITTQGNTTYTLSELDLREVIKGQYCNTQTNFGGWAILIVYKNQSFPNYQLNVYDGLQLVPETITIIVDNLNVQETKDARIGFIAWEGDKGGTINETLRINDTILSNPPLNPATNAFNGTNSITGSDQLYSMDLDIYDIEDYIEVGDTSAVVQLTSGNDVILINTVVTRINSLVPDATISAQTGPIACGSRSIDIDLTLNNIGQADLPINTPITLSIDGDVLQTINSTQLIVPSASESLTTQLTIPDIYGDSFTIAVTVDPANSIQELDENNNRINLPIVLLANSLNFPIQDVVLCNTGNGQGVYDVSNVINRIKQDTNQSISLYGTEQDALLKINPIDTTVPLQITGPIQIVYGRIEQQECFNINSFSIAVENCPTAIRNFLSPNNDGVNDFIDFNENKNAFPNMEIEIYSRWGQLVWQGNYDYSIWDGRANHGLIQTGQGDLPDGVYFYVVHLNDTLITSPIKGFIHLSKD
ncbi:MAG: gliding motility-associated C-terminal domain-containing protein [Flavobacteriales bacterium]|nr:gliding motility-associated C-terminal domain-containing protein [Flavobacteriales bacterium]